MIVEQLVADMEIATRVEEIDSKVDNHMETIAKVAMDNSSHMAR